MERFTEKGNKNEELERIISAHIYAYLLTEVSYDELDFNSIDPDYIFDSVEFVCVDIDDEFAVYIYASSALDVIIKTIYCFEDDDIVLQIYVENGNRHVKKVSRGEWLYGTCIHHKGSRRTS